MTDVESRCIAFLGSRRLAEGGLEAVALAVKAALAADGTATALVFDAVSSRPIDLDLRGSDADVLARLRAAAPPPPPAASAVPPAPRGPGRPKLGVVAREVTLLPRHWEWLAAQPGGASVALRRLVEEARRANVGPDARRQAQESAYRFMSAMAGDAPGFEAASRAFFAGDRPGFEAAIAAWPADIAAHATGLAAAAFNEP